MHAPSCSRPASQMLVHGNNSNVLLASLPLVYPPLGVVYWLGVGGVAILLVYEHALVRPNDLNRVNIAFFNINAVISLGLFAIGSLDLWLGLGR